MLKLMITTASLACLLSASLFAADKNKNLTFETNAYHLYEQPQIQQEPKAFKPTSWQKFKYAEGQKSLNSSLVHHPRIPYSVRLMNP